MPIGTGGRADRRATSSVTFVICSVLEGSEGMTAAMESLLIWWAGMALGGRDDETERERLMLCCYFHACQPSVRSRSSVGLAAY